MHMLQDDLSGDDLNEDDDDDGDSGDDVASPGSASRGIAADKAGVQLSERERTRTTEARALARAGLAPGDIRSRG